MKSLIKNIQNGDQDAVTEFYNQYSQQIFRYLHAKMSNEDAQEVMNDVFLDAIESMYALSSESKLRSWLFKIAHNKMVDFYRKKKIKSVLLSQIPFLELIAEEINEPEFQYEKARMKEQIEDCLRSLPEKYEQIIRFHYEDHLTIKEIGNVLNLSPKAAESLLFRARQQFKIQYERS